MDLIVGITGTPGTGKSSVHKALGVDLLKLELDDVIAEQGFHDGVDEIRGSLMAEVNDLNDYVHENLKEMPLVVLSGHLAHHLNVDAVVVLRTDPRVLRKRLHDKGFDKPKIDENAEAELIDVILIESVESHSAVYEVNTTDMAVEETTGIVKGIINELVEGCNNSEDSFSSQFKPGSIDWTDQL